MPQGAGDHADGPMNPIVRTIRRALAARAHPLPDRARRYLVGVAFLLFVGAGVWAWIHRPQGDVDTNWWLLLLSLVMAVPGLFLKALEYATAARILSQRPSFRSSLEISVLSSAANLLPVPGSAIVTMQSLSAHGSTYGAALSSTAAVSLAWVATTLVYGGAGVAVASGPLWLAAGLVSCGVGLLAVTWRIIESHAGSATFRLWLRTVVLESAFIANATVRFWLILRAIGISATVAQSVSMTIAATLANALAFVPGGLGIRELIAAGISPLVDIAPEGGLLMAVLDRVQWLAVLAVAAAVVAARRGFRQPFVGESRDLHDRGAIPT